MQVTRPFLTATPKTYSTVTWMNANPNLNNVYHEQYRDTREQILALNGFAELPTEVKAVHPLFSGNCKEYANQVLYSKYTVLNSKNSDNREEVFYNLIKSCNDEALPESIRKDLLSLKWALNDNNAFVNLDVSALKLARPDMGDFDLSDLNLDQRNRE